jgi:hypothetical protein
MIAKKGVTYWGRTGGRVVEKRVDLIETRNSGTQYVKWTFKKKSGADGNSSWTERRKFEEWIVGVYENES